MKRTENNFFYGGNTLRIVFGITMLVLLLAGSASALYDNEAQTFLGLINNYRAQNNIGALSIDASLQDSANWMSNDMLTGCVAGKYTCSHTDSTGRAFDQRLRDFGYPAGTTASAGENLAWGFNGGATTAQQVIDLWKNSPGHRANMLGSSYVAISISRSCNAGDCAWVTDFGSRVVKPYNPTPTPVPPIIPASGSISGYNINDLNGNGKWDTGEKGLASWTIRLAGTSNDGSYITKETLTDAMGFYKFDNIPAGTYTVREKLKRGFVSTGSSALRILLEAGKNSIRNNFTVRVQ